MSKKLTDSCSHEYNAIFISDVHIGSKDAQLIKLSKFIKCCKTKKIFMVGDIVDLWMGKKMHLDENLYKLVRKLLKKAEEGTEIIYLPGNHDELLRTLDTYSFSNVKIIDRYVHYTAKGKKCLVIHGDQYDPIVLYNKWLAHLGSWAYDLLVSLNTTWHKVCLFFGWQPTSLAAYVKCKVKSAAKFITRFENALIKAAKKENVDVVICGHIHEPIIKLVEGITYVNCGDWLEHCTVIVEHLNGELELIKIKQVKQ